MKNEAAANTNARNLMMPGVFFLSGEIIMEIKGQ